MKKFLFLFTTVFIISSTLSCSITKKATLINLESGEKVMAIFKDNSGTSGYCEAIMPDGEKLVGTYVGVRGTDVITYGSATGKVNSKTNYSSAGQNILDASSASNYSATGAARTVGGQGKAYAILSSTLPNSTLTLEIIAIYNVLGGGGYGDAKTNDGRSFKVVFN